MIKVAVETLLEFVFWFHISIYSKHSESHFNYCLGQLLVFRYFFQPLSICFSIFEFRSCRDFPLWKNWTKSAKVHIFWLFAGWYDLCIAFAQSKIVQKSICILQVQLLVFECGLYRHFLQWKSLASSYCQLPDFHSTSHSRKIRSVACFWLKSLKYQLLNEKFRFVGSICFSNALWFRFYRYLFLWKNRSFDVWAAIIHQ